MAFTTMEDHTPKPVTGFPVENPTSSYWQTPPLPISNQRTTPELPLSTEYCIVGSGITGALIAYQLLVANPSAQILMLEARTASSGATGRNGGHCRAGRYLSFADDVAKDGVDEALKLEELENANVYNVAQLISKLDIPCDLKEVETVDAFMDPVQWEAALACLKARDDIRANSVISPDQVKSANGPMAQEYKVWHAKEAREKLMFPNVVGAIAYRAYTLSPYKFVCWLLEWNVKQGMNLQTNTLVTSVEPSQISSSTSTSVSPQWKVQTARGTVQARHVILATNAYTGALCPPLSRFIIPTRGQIAVVRPGSKISDSSVLRRSCAIADVTASPYYHCRAPGLSGEGDIVVGGGRTIAPGREQPIFDDSTIHLLVSKYLSTQLATYFGADVWGDDSPQHVVQQWTGIMGYTRDAKPIVGQAPGKEGLWICAGFHGHGKLESAPKLI